MIGVGEEGLDFILPVPEVFELTLFGILVINCGNDGSDACLDYHLLNLVRLISFVGILLVDKDVVRCGDGYE